MGTNHPGSGISPGVLIQTGSSRTGQGPVVNHINGSTVHVTGLVIQCGELNTVTDDQNPAADTARHTGHGPQVY
ncbi:hypothetical protein ACGF07_33630 [Kitasatospora sp. NPDC048194]|uniref:hypothetical protein n=1 Tax=Kitasatospora sp. NPDC048194 TaxID=3364045 RepID=UPI0037195520